MVRQARCEIAEDALHRKSDACASHTEPGDERQQLDAEVLQRHDDEYTAYQQSAIVPSTNVRAARDRT